MNLHSGSGNEFVVVVNTCRLLAVLMEGFWFVNNGLFFSCISLLLFFLLINTLAFFGMCIVRRRPIDHKISYSPIFHPLCDLAFFPSFSFHGMLFVLQTPSLPRCNLTFHFLVSCTMQHAESRCGGELEVSYNVCTGFKQAWLLTSWITSKQHS